MTDVDTNLRLYVAGNGPNSRMALANLHDLCEKYLHGRHRLEIVDVLLEPQRALQDGVFMTPLLSILSAIPVQNVVGNLSQTSIVLAALGIRETPP
jgi:circadian clock protein KaiB